MGLGGGLLDSAGAWSLVRCSLFRLSACPRMLFMYVLVVVTISRCSLQLSTSSRGVGNIGSGMIFAGWI